MRNFDIKRNVFRPSVIFVSRYFPRIEFPNANLLFTTFERSELESLETDSRFHPLSDSNVARIAAIGKPRK